MAADSWIELFHVSSAVHAATSLGDELSARSENSACLRLPALAGQEPAETVATRKSFKRSWRSSLVSCIVIGLQGYCRLVLLVHGHGVCHQAGSDLDETLRLSTWLGPVLLARCITYSVRER